MHLCGGFQDQLPCLAVVHKEVTQQGGFQVHVACTKPPPKQEQTMLLTFTVRAFNRAHIHIITQELVD